MELITVKDLMVPLEEYAKVSEEATLFEAVMALEEAQQLYQDKYKYRHRAILVYDNDKKIIGKISQLDVLRGLEPRYGQIGDIRTISKAGFSQSFLKSMLQNFSLCDASLTEMCSKGAKVKVKDFMYTPEEGEYVEAESSLCEAIHQFVMGRHQSLLVVEEKKIVGILRLTDTFMKVFEIMRHCEMG